MVSESIGLAELRQLMSRLGDLVKAVVDIDSRLMAVGGELHADEEAVLIEQGSVQASLWGINLYPEQYPDEDWIEFDSMINIRPSQQNRTRSVDDPATRESIRRVVSQLVKA